MSAKNRGCSKYLEILSRGINNVLSLGVYSGICPGGLETIDFTDLERGAEPPYPLPPEYVYKYRLI